MAEAVRTPEPAGAGAGPAGRLFASPLARRIAREAGLDLGGIAGTGPNGRITGPDVERAIAAPSGPVPPTIASHLDPIRPRRWASASPVAVSTQATGQLCLHGSARVDELLAIQRQINEPGDLTVSIKDFVLMAVAQAHQAVPAMNVMWTGDTIRQSLSVDVAVAVEAGNELVAPVLRSVESMSLARICAGVQDLATRAGGQGIRPDECEGATITVTDLGGHGTEEFTGIINPPQVATLAIGAARQQPVVRDGAVEVGTVTRVTLAVDHQVINGAVAARWMQAILSLLAAPARILAR